MQQFFTVLKRKQILTVISLQGYKTRKQNDREQSNLNPTPYSAASAKGSHLFRCSYQNKQYPSPLPSFLRLLGRRTEPKTLINLRTRASSSLSLDKHNLWEGGSVCLKRAKLRSNLLMLIRLLRCQRARSRDKGRSF
ncbi:hypothetical protein CDAR_465621 [Caerostris darwini]|uniref:Uncharacterized protein n=1 Tax=Caerostris darwini TaxID=1538125 RepID=A0AAV4TTG9_9ARAC|nr:hypothetical protein CDAR_465621 [Caerostris darwini]